jgi:hypothetical protein
MAQYNMENTTSDLINSNNDKINYYTKKITISYTIFGEVITKKLNLKSIQLSNFLWSIIEMDKTCIDNGINLENQFNTFSSNPEYLIYSLNFIIKYLDFYGYREEKKAYMYPIVGSNIGSIVDLFQEELIIFNDLIQMKVDSEQKMKKTIDILHLILHIANFFELNELKNKVSCIIADKLLVIPAKLVMKYSE